MPEMKTFGWIVESKTPESARQEWQVMVARCVKRLGKPPVGVLAGRVALMLLAQVAPEGVTLRSAVQMHPCQCLLETEERDG